MNGKQEKHGWVFAMRVFAMQLFVAVCSLKPTVVSATKSYQKLPKATKMIISSRFCSCQFSPKKSKIPHSYKYAPA